jgi:hypothetical protein
MRPGNSFCGELFLVETLTRPWQKICVGVTAVGVGTCGESSTKTVDAAIVAEQEGNAR